jgi:hypothetical protein
MTDALLRDLTIIKNRSALDAKRHYKREKKGSALPKYFQVGTIVGGATDYYNRVERRQKRDTLVEELMGDSSKTAYFKKKYDKVQVKRAYTAPAWLKKKILGKKK